MTHPQAPTGHVRLALLVLAPALALSVADAEAAWPGFTEQGDALGADAYDFGVAGGGNENYYDGAFGDFDGDGRIDRALISRYGLLFNTGGGVFVPASTQIAGTAPNSGPTPTGYLFGDEVQIGNDAVHWADVDADGDLDSIQGGNGEQLTLQTNADGRFSVTWKQGGQSALNIIQTDVERDGDVDLVIAHAFCAKSDCGGPLDFDLLINNGTGTFTEESAMRGLPLAASNVVGLGSADFDRDGDFDLAIMRGIDSMLVIAENDGDGFYTQTAVPYGIAGEIGSGFAQAVMLGDVDDDGDIDVATTHALYSQVSNNPDVNIALWINDDGVFDQQSDTRFDDAGHPDDLGGDNGVMFDVDYDGDLDFGIYGREERHFQVLLNDGAGMFTFDAAHSSVFPGTTAELGADVEVADIDDDGLLDLWIGNAAEAPQLMINQPDDQAAPGRPDIPTGLAVEAEDAGGIRVAWDLPNWAASARHFEVWRSTGPRMDEDRQLIHRVAVSRFEDESFAAPISRHTTALELMDANVAIDAGANRIAYTDSSARPGIEYWYSVRHVGTSNARSRFSGEVAGTVPGEGESDPPALEFVEPSQDHWSRHPRIVLSFGDESGVDLATLEVTADADLGTIVAGEDISEYFDRRDANAYVFAPTDQAFPPLTLITLSATISDTAGNQAMATRQFFTSQDSPQPPTASIDSVAPMAGQAPITIALDASSSGDADGLVMDWEWYAKRADGYAVFSQGRLADLLLTEGGSYTLELVVRDNQGGVDREVSAGTIEIEDPIPGDGDGDTTGDGDGDSTGDGDGDTTAGEDVGEDDLGTGDGNEAPELEGDDGCACTAESESGQRVLPFGWLALFALAGLRRRTRA